MEGDRHHAGELSAPLHPQVPTQTLLPAQLLQADLLKRPRGSPPASVTAEGCPCPHPAEPALRPENQTRTHPL